MSTVGERVKAARVGAGLSQARLADAVGVRRQAVNLWEHNKANPTWTNLSEVARVCEVSLEEITQGSPQLEPLTTAPQIKGWVSRRLAAVNQGLNEYMEAVIEAEVERRLAEELETYGLTRHFPEEERAHVRRLIAGYVNREHTDREPTPGGPPEGTGQSSDRRPQRRKHPASSRQS